jgi:hypothetical protein
MGESLLAFTDFSFKFGKSPKEQAITEFISEYFEMAPHLPRLISQHNSPNDEKKWNLVRIF